MEETLRSSPVLGVARAKVRELLTRSRAFRALPEEQRHRLAHDMVKVAAYVSGGPRGETVPSGIALVDPTSGRSRLANKRPRAGQLAGGSSDVAGADFQASAASGGVQTLGQAIQSVDFPQFVSGLIDGVFGAIVDASIKQMEAYSELVKNVAKSVDQFMKDNVSENQARDYLVDRYPDSLELNLESDEPRVDKRQDADEDDLPDFFSDLGLDMPLDDFEDDTPEQVLMPAARKRMAMDRQQLLATMVLMGINRIVVTDGKISASVVFQLDTTDLVEREYSRSAESHTAKSRRRRPGFASWFRPSVTRENSYSRFKVTTHQEEDSEAKADLKVKLKGNVDVNFKSETFPLERMADMLIVNEIRGKAPGQLETPPPDQNVAGGV